MAANNHAIQALIDSGADAQKNMFDTWVTFPWATDDQKTIVSTRASGFDIPDATVGEEDRVYHGTKIKVPTAEVNIERSFTLTFRLDAGYNLYRSFITWQSLAGDPVSGGVANWATATGKVEVKALSGTYDATAVSNYIDDTSYAVKGDANATWTFYDVWVSKVSQPKFDGGSTGHAEYTVDFRCGDIDYPFYNGAGITGTGKGGAIG